MCAWSRGGLIGGRKWVISGRKFAWGGRRIRREKKAGIYGAGCVPGSTIHRRWSQISRRFAERARTDGGKEIKKILLERTRGVSPLHGGQPSAAVVVVDNSSWARGKEP